VDGIPCTAATRTLIDTRLLEHQAVGDRPLESPLEVKVWRLVRSSALPLPERQVPILDSRVDLLCRAEGVIVECDGFEAHAGYLRWKRDRRRVGAIEAEGYRFVHVTWDDATKRPDEMLGRVRHALREGGGDRSAAVG
jgi:very-short-patch-repair endonuclease